MNAVAIERETNNYWELIKDISKDVKLALISRLSASLAYPQKKKKVAFEDVFGAWSDEEYLPAEDIIKEIKQSRTFKNRNKITHQKQQTQ